MVRVAQQRLIRLCRLGGHHRATVAVARHGKTRRHVVAQECDVGVVRAVGDRIVPPAQLLSDK